jgi:hypothetical protein
MTAMIECKNECEDNQLLLKLLNFLILFLLFAGCLQCRLQEATGESSVASCSAGGCRQVVRRPAFCHHRALEFPNHMLRMDLPRTTAGHKSLPKPLRRYQREGEQSPYQLLLQKQYLHDEALYLATASEIMPLFLSAQ